jgi:hypothetical protein
MNSSQFKFKPDKIKYLSNIDTLDSSHRKTITNIHKKRENYPKKIKKLAKLKNDLINLDNNNSDVNYITLRASLIQDIAELEEDIYSIENYEDEIEYYSKTHQILLNYYDIIDGQTLSEIEILENNKNTNSDIEQSDYYFSDIPLSTSENLKSCQSNEDFMDSEASQMILNNKIENESVNLPTDNLTTTWDNDNFCIFNSKSSKLDLLNQLSKLKRKEKKTTRKRVKNVESLIKDNNNILDYIDNYKRPEVIIKQIPINNTVNDRASLFEDYKTLLEGHQSKKKYNKSCTKCNKDKVLIYSEGIYACLQCGEVENCIIESEVINYKDPMIEKPTFPYKRKNHFCELTSFILNCSSKWMLNTSASLLI